jgi:branched-chain amino acid transport system permease protein
VNTLVAGLGIGCIYAAIALGFGIISYVTGIANFAQGSVAMVGAYALAVGTGVLPVPLLVLACLLVGGVAAVAIQYLAVYPVRHEIHNHTWLLSVIGMSIVLESGAGVLFGYDPRPAAPPPGSGHSLLLGGVRVPSDYLLMAAFLVVAVIAVELLLARRHWFGRALRAVAADEEAATLMGIPAPAIKTAAWFVGGCIAAAAGALAAPTLSLSPNMASHVGILAIIAAVVGGLGRVGLAPVVGGLTLGVVEVWAQSTFGGAWSGIVAVAVLSVLLIARPQGLLPQVTAGRI